MFEWHQSSEEDMINAGLKGRQYLIDNKMDAVGMCSNVINDIITCLENFKPKNRFTLIKL